MKCNETQDLAVAYIENNLLNIQQADFENHLNTCAHCQQEVERMKHLLSLLSKDKMEIPSDDLRLTFEKTLEEAKSSHTKVISIEKKVNWKTYLNVAAMMAVVFSAFLIGKFQSNIKGMATNNENTKQKTALLALIENESASKRILAVSNSENFSKTDTKILQALINRLLFDKNTSVRLAAVEALSNFTSEETVKIALIKALETEKKPSIQIELIQILAKIKEKRALIPMRKMLADKEIPSYVKQQLTLNLPSIL